MNKRNNFFTRFVVAFMLVALLAGNIPTQFISAQAAFVTTTMTPYVLTTGSDADQNKARHYEYTSNGNSLVKFVVQESGCVSIKISTEKAGYIPIAIHKKSDASDLPTNLKAQCTEDRGNQDTILQYMKKGTYYLKFPENTYKMDMMIYPSKSRTLKNNTFYAGYCDYNTTNTFTYKATKTGYLNFKQKPLIATSAAYKVSFYNAKGKEIMDIVCDHNTNRPIIFPVKKGQTYVMKIKTLNTDGKQYYQVRAIYTPRSKKCGTTKAKAKAIGFAKSAPGMIFAEESEKNADWYKVTNPATQPVLLTIFGHTYSGSLDFTVYNASGRKLGVYHLMPTTTVTLKYWLKNTKKKTTMPKGTYYVKVQKSKKETAGIYSFKFSKQ